MSQPYGDENTIPPRQTPGFDEATLPPAKAEASEPQPSHGNHVQLPLTSELSEVAAGHFRQSLWILKDELCAEKSPSPATQSLRNPQTSFSMTRMFALLATIGFWVFAILVCMIFESVNLLLLAGGMFLIGYLWLSRRKKTESVDSGLFVPTSIDAPIELTSEASKGAVNNAKAAGDEQQPQHRSTTNSFLPSDDLFPLQDPALPAETMPSSRRSRVFVLAGSLSIWGAIALSSWPDLTSTYILLTLILHECGHFAAMYLRGYSSLSMFFIPLILGAVTGRKPDATPVDQLIVLFAGPLPGLLCGCLLYWLDIQTQLPLDRDVAFYLVSINLLNLLPIWPLDGGRICWVLFARESAIAQAMLTVCSIVGAVFVFVAPQGGAMFLVVSGLFILGRIPDRFQQARGALAFLRLHPTAPTEIRQLSWQQLLDLYHLSKPAKDDSSKLRVLRMKSIFSDVALLPRSGAPLRALLLYALVWLVAVATAAGTNLQKDSHEAGNALGTLFDSVIQG